MKVKILAIDDDANILKLLTVSLKRFGHTVDTAETYAAAMEKMAAGEYDIILTDKNFPGEEGDPKGGMAVLKYAKTHFPGTEVVMITGYASIDTAVEAMKLGAFDYVRKPFSIHEINEKIERIMAYKSFINPQNTIEIYKNLHNDILSLLEEKGGPPNREIHELITELDGKIDMLFREQKERERIIINQKESLGNISVLVRQLMEDLPENDTCRQLAEEIYAESKKRI